MISRNVVDERKFFPTFFLTAICLIEDFTRYIDRNLKTSALRLLEPSHSVFHSTNLVGPRSNWARLNARHVARMQNTGPCLVVRIKFVFSGDTHTEMEMFLDDSISCIPGFRKYHAAALDRGNRLNSCMT